MYMQEFPNDNKQNNRNTEIQKIFEVLEQNIFNTFQQGNFK